MHHQEQIKPENEILAESLGALAEAFVREVDAGRYGSDMNNQITRLAYAMRETITDFSEEIDGRRIITDLDKFQEDIAGMRKAVLKQYPSALEPTIEKMFGKVTIEAASAENAGIEAEAA